jgi:peroxiredoxin
MKPSGKIIARLFLAASFLFAASPFALALEVGDKAPDFELDSSKGGKLKLSDLRGKNVLLNFYRNDFDPTWAKQLLASGSDDNYAKFKAENTEVLGITAATMFAQKAFADYFKISYPLLGGGRDVTVVHKMLKTYGVLDEPRLTAKRAYIIIDKDGIIRYYDIRPGNSEKDLLSTEVLLNEVKKINKGI